MWANCLGSWTTYPRNNRRMAPMGSWRLIWTSDFLPESPSCLHLFLSFRFRQGICGTICSTHIVRELVCLVIITRRLLSTNFVFRKCTVNDNSWIPLYMVVGGREAKPNICVPRRCLNHSYHDAYHVPHFSKYNAFLLVPFSCNFMRERSFANSTMQSNSSRDVRQNPALHGSVHCPVALWNISGSSPMLL